MPLGTSSDGGSFYFSCRKSLERMKKNTMLMYTSETKGKTLEELDQVFSVPTHVHAAYGLRQIPYFFNRYILRRNVQPEILYQREDYDVAEET
jgi:hypothetical protein